MDNKGKMLNATKYIGGSVLAFGILTFLIGFFGSSSSVLTPIGIGAVVGAVFIFLIGVFFVAGEEMLEKAFKRFQPYKSE